MPPKGCKSSPLNALTKSRTTLIPLNTNYNFNQLCFFTAPAKLSVKWNQSILCKRGRGRLSVNCQRTDRDGDPLGWYRKCLISTALNFFFSMMQFWVVFECLVV
jgi:hypothetical protein